MVRLHSINIKMQLILSPLSAFRVHVLVLQTLYNMKEMCGGKKPEKWSNNHVSDYTNDIPQGTFHPNAHMMTWGFLDHDGKVVDATLIDHWSPIFEWQMKLMDNYTWSEEMMRMVVTKPNVQVLSDC